MSLVKFVDNQVNNNGVIIHYLESKSESEINQKSPLVYIPGMLGFAEQFLDEMNEFKPRKCVAMSLRGCGKSSVPLTGYSFDDHFSDVEAVINNCGVSEFYLMAYSMGVPYAINAALKQPDKIKGLIICDYPPRMPQLPKDWVQKVLSNSVVEKSKKHFVTALQQELKETDLTNQLDHIKCPVLVIRGLKEDAMLKNKYLEEYKDRLINLEIVEFKDSGHQLWIPNYERFINVIKDFMEKFE